MLESFLLVATLTLANGEQLEATGEEYPTLEECYRANRKEMNKIRADIRKRPNVFRDMTFRCEHLKVIYPEAEGVNLNAN